MGVMFIARGSKKRRKNDVWKKSGGVCAHCGRKISSINRTVEHYVPRSEGGGYDRRNLIPLCKKCNQSRASNNIDPWEYYLFAPRQALIDCCAYATEFYDNRRTLSDYNDQKKIS